MKIEATFIGLTNSDYVYGNTYELYVYGTYLSKLDGNGGLCPYDSIASFLSNWDCIKILL